jgi:RNA polymerase sigma-70 factor (ECF subfamily)
VSSSGALLFTADFVAKPRSSRYLRDVVDRDAIEALYRRYASLVLRRALALLGNQALAEDAVQEVFVRVLGSYGRFRHEARPTTWLYRITTNHCLNLLRDHGRRRALLAERLGPPAEASPSSADAAALLRQVFHGMPERLQEVAVYYYLDQMSQDEIAEVLGVSRKVVRTRLEAFKARVAPDRLPPGPGEPP